MELSEDAVDIEHIMSAKTKPIKSETAIRTELKILYQNFELKSNQNFIGDILNSYIALFPLWLNELTITIYDDHGDRPEGMMAWSKARPEYGVASISIMSGWLDRPEGEQRSFILHEVLHIAQRREYNFVWDRLLNPIQDKNEELHTFLVEDYRERNEEFIGHLTDAILNGGVRG